MDPPCAAVCFWRDSVVAAKPRGADRDTFTHHGNALRGGRVLCHRPLSKRVVADAHCVRVACDRRADQSRDTRDTRVWRNG